MNTSIFNRSLLVALSLSLTPNLATAASGKKVEEISTVDQFKNLSADQLSADTFYSYHTENPAPYTDWAKDEKDLLSLYDGYQEPTVMGKNDNEMVLEKLSMFVSMGKTIVNKSPANIDLKQLISMGFIQSVDPEIKHKEIKAPDVMNLSLKRAQKANQTVSNFRWCNSSGQDITRPMREKYLDYLDNPIRPWCSDPSRSKCIESCYLFNSGWKNVLKFANTTMFREEDRRKDYGMAVQSELRYYVSEAEFGKRRALSDLTGIKTPVRGVFEQSMLYYNQVFQYGKVLAVFQEDPTNAGRTIVSTFVAIGIRSRSFVGSDAKNTAIREIIMGRGSNIKIGGLPLPARINTETGITAGLPVYTRDLAKAITTSLE